MRKFIGYMKKFNIILLILWIFVVVFCALHHEIWRDEAQVWCIVRDLNILDAFKTSIVEGHPFLWYLLVFPFAKLGLSVEIMQILGGLFVLFSVAFLLFKSPFSILEKTIIIFSAGMVYYLPVVVRNYALIPLLVFLLAYFYNKKTEKPILYTCLIILLSHTHLYMLGFCGVLFLVFIYDLFKTNKKLSVLPVVLCTLNFLIIFLLFSNSQNENYALDSAVKTHFSIGMVLSLIAKVLTFNLAKFSALAIKYFDFISLLLFYPAIILFLIGLFKNDKRSALIFTGSVGFILFVFTKIYFNGILYQKIFLIFIIMIFCFWICENKNKIITYSFCSLFLVSTLVAPVVVYEEIGYNFSGSKEIAEYIKENLNEEEIIIAVGNPFMFSTVSAYLPNKKFYSVLTENYVTYSTFKNMKLGERLPFPENVDYNLAVEKSDLKDNPYFEFVYSTQEENLSSKTEREVFKLYKRKKL